MGFTGDDVESDRWILVGQVEGGRDDALAYGQDGQRCFDRACCTDRVTQRRLGCVDGRVIAECTVDCACFGQVADAGRCRVGIDVLHILGAQPCDLDSSCDGPCRSASFRVGCHQMIPIPAPSSRA